MYVGHDPVITANTRHTTVLHCAQVEGAKFTDHVAITDLQQSRFASVLLVLRGGADR